MKRLPLAIALIACSSSSADDEPGIAFFESKIRPALVEHCYECHSLESGKSKGDLLLDSRESIRKVVTPGEPADSLLLAAIKHVDPDLEMPPQSQQLPAAVIADFERWITMGAPDPRESNDKSSAPVTLEAGRAFWAFKKPFAPVVPKSTESNWAKRELDHFILADLEANDLKPSHDAKPAVLLRRLHFDLVGLPPSPESLKQFQQRLDKDGIDRALEIEVDALLNSDRYGERWARHWMDVARFAESSGKESNLTFPHAWRYRDYAIDAFNDDIPFDRFLTEQIAGDLLPAESDAERARLTIATGFLAFGAKGLNEQNDFQFLADQIDEQIDTVTRSFIGQSVACARCHDHKFDAFSMNDYYAMAGIFLSSETFFGTWIDPENNVGGKLITLPELEGQLVPNPSMPKAKVDELKEKGAALNAEEAAGVKSLRDALRIIWQRGGLEGKLATVDDEGNALPLCMGVQENAKIQDCPLLERGEISKPKDTVKRGFPLVMELDVETPPSDSSGRLELAQWLTHPDHPLTARVMVNRIWQQLLGTGIVSSVDNFGFTGQQPDHPELLDYLAIRFQNEGWSTKSMIREIVLSRTYRQSSDWREAAFLKDPENKLLWRASKRRLQAESIRDAMLAVSGQLDLTRRPGSLVAEVRGQSVALFGFNKQLPRDLDGCHFRSVYLPVVRDRLPDVLELFDFAEPSLVTGRRDTTNVPLQALYLMNSPFVLEQSAALAERVKGDIDLAYQLCFARAPTDEERQMAQKFLQSNRSEDKAVTALCQALLSTAEFRNLD